MEAALTTVTPLTKLPSIFNASFTSNHLQATNPRCQWGGAGTNIKFEKQIVINQSIHICSNIKMSS
jgi:hypothetical protein